MSDAYRGFLSPYLDHRIECTAIYDTTSAGCPPHNKNVLVQDCDCNLPNGSTIYASHFWIQKANEIVNEKPNKGDKIRFTAIINKYRKRVADDANGNPQYVDAYGLSNPADVEVLDYPVYRSPLLPGPVSPVIATASAKAVEPPANPAKLFKAVKELVATCGAPQLLACLPHLQAIADAVKQAGGTEAFGEIIGVLQ